MPLRATEVGAERCGRRRRDRHHFALGVGYEGLDDAALCLAQVLEGRAKHCGIKTVRRLQAILEALTARVRSDQFAETPHLSLHLLGSNGGARPNPGFY